MPDAAFHPPATQVIPVLDLMGGQVVHAVRGERSAYRPIVSPLAAGSEPATLARALLALCPAPPGQPPLLYIADLDALTGGAAQRGALTLLLKSVPGFRLWLDAGFHDPAEARRFCHSLGAPGRVQPVIASESLRDASALASLAGDADAILSLDSRQATPMDPAGVWQRPELWPATVIVMTLDRVGAAGGPDLDQLHALQQRAAADGRRRRWIGAGGLRDAADLARAADAGAAGWLVASALHDGRLDPRRGAA
jgi:uncharacterized protein related to proFAR isomerase